MEIKIKYFSTTTGKSAKEGLMPFATLEAMVNGETRTAISIGSGSIDALFNALKEVVGYDIKPIKREIKAESNGSDSKSTAIVTISYSGQTYIGVGNSSDIEESALLAYIDAINNIEATNRNYIPPFF